LQAHKLAADAEALLERSYRGVEVSARTLDVADLFERD